MRDMQTEQILAMPRLETFTVKGVSPDVLKADALAWEALDNVLGADPSHRWRLKVMQHEYEPESGGTKWSAEFVRLPDEDES